MKNKTVRLLLPIVLLAVVAVLVAIVRSTESPNDRLPLKEIWTFHAGDRIVATPILIDDQIFFRTANKMYSINSVDGSANWEIAARASAITINVNLLGKPIMGNTKFLISEEQDNSIGIYSTKTGEKLWTVDGQINDINALEIVDDVMIVARHDGNLVVYDLTSHEKLWEVPLPPRAPTPIAANHDLVISGAGDILHIYSLRDGSLLHEKTYDEALIIEIELIGSNIFVGIADNGNYSISSLQLDSLNENWVYNAGAEISHPYLSGTIEHLSVFNQNILLLDSKSGNLVWKDESQKQYSAPAFQGNSLFFASTQGLFDKEKLCKAKISQGITADCSVTGTTGIKQYLHLSGPIVTNDLLVVARGSEIVAFTMP